MARQAVFATSELLEKIILYLPMKTIFGIQRVSQKFKAVIDASPDIQTKIFRRLRGIQPETWVADKTSKHGVRKFDPEARPADLRGREEKLLRPVTLNPLLKVVRGPKGFRSAQEWIEWNSSSAPSPRDRAAWSGYEHVRIDVQRGLLGNDRSFLNAYITDPPTLSACAAIAAEYQVDPNMEPEYGIVLGSEVKSENGLTIGDVIFARGLAVMSWKDGTGDFEGDDIDLQEMMETAACPIVEDEDSYPTGKILLFGVCLPTEEQWTAVSSEQKGATT